MELRLLLANSGGGRSPTTPRSAYARSVRAAIVAVGSELLGTERLDTNSLKLAAAFERHGVELGRKAVVGDLEDDLIAELGLLVGLFGLVVIGGGLGPTADDVTRPAVARALGRGVRTDPALVEWLEARFRSMGLRMPEVNRRQAEVIEGAEVLANPRGTAPGLVLVEGATTLFLLPGVPSELAGMIADHLEPWLAARSAGRSREAAVLKVACVPESTLEERISPAYAEFGREAITVLAKPGDVEVWASAVGEEAERRRRLETMSRRLRELVGPAVYADSPEDSLEAVVGRLLRQSGATLAAAESCTGGLLAERVTRVAGSSDYFVGGAVTYSNALKTALLGVPEELLARHGAVSEEVARAMAEGARSRLGSDYALAITGVAGPGGGTAEKPVGTVHLALAGPGETETEHRRVRYPGDRQRIRWLASQVALEMLRRRLLGIPGLG